MKEKLRLIEDDADYRMALGTLLAPHFEIREAVTLHEGVHIALGHEFFCILLDLALPDSKGEETFRTFAEVTNAASVVIISGSEDPDLVTSCIQAGATGYIVKGRDDVDAEHLLNAIHRAVLQRSSERGLERAAKIAHDTAHVRKDQQ